MKNTKLFFLFLLISLCFFANNLLAQENTNLFKFEERIDNSYVGAYTFSPNPDYFTGLFGLDANRYNNTGHYYGVGVERKKNIIYYFDRTTMEYRYYGINPDNNKRFFQLPDKVATAGNGYFCVADAISEKIYYFHLDDPDYLLPEGRIPGKYGNVEDLYFDENDDLYVLDNRYNTITKYSLNEKQLVNIGTTGTPVLEMEEHVSILWGRARGLVVRNDNIYVVFERGRVVKINAAGEIVNRYLVSRDDTGLWVRASKDFSDSWLESIAIDPYDNIYVLDVNAGLIHVLDTELNYISSWSDPDHPVEKTATDISFARGLNNMFITHPWGFYVFTTQSTLSGIKVEDDFIYPDLVCDEYPGLKVEVSVIGSGKFNLILKATDGDAAYSLYQKKLYLNERVEFIWNGKTKGGTEIPAGNYMLQFSLDGVLVKKHPVSVREAPGVAVTGDDNQVITATNSVLNYTLLPDEYGYIQAWIKAAGSGEQKRVFHRTLLPENFSFTYDFNKEVGDYVDDLYSMEFSALPAELRGLAIRHHSVNKNFVINKTTLALSTISYDKTEINPLMPAYKPVRAAFSMNEGAGVTVMIIDSGNNDVTCLLDNVPMGAGTNFVEWDGIINNTLVPDGYYKFHIFVSQEYTGETAIAEGPLFRIDASPPEITYSASSLDTYYISPTEPSSPGVRDDIGITDPAYTLGFTYDEEVTTRAYIIDNTREVICDLYTDTLYNAGENVDVSWDGKNGEGEYVPDGRYTIYLEAKDRVENLLTNTIPVYVDNNTLPETGGSRQFFESARFKVNFSTPKSHRFPSVCEIPGGFFIAWNDKNEDDTEADIYGRIFQSDCTPLKDPFAINVRQQYRMGHPALTCLDDGVIVVWHIGDLDGSGFGVYARKFDFSGNPLTNRFRVNTTTEGDQWFPAVTALNSGFVVVWSSGNSDRQIIGRWFDNTCTPLDGEFTISKVIDDDHRLPALAQTSSGFAVAWHMLHDIDGNIKSRIYTDDCTPLTGQLPMNSIVAGSQTHAGVAYGQDKLVLVWESEESDGTGINIYARLYDENGVIGPEFRVNTSVQESHVWPNVEAIDDGFVVVWNSIEEENNAYYRMYDYNGNPLTGEVVINETGEGSHSAVNAGKTDGGFVLTWMTQYPEDGLFNVYAKKYENVFIPAGKNLQAFVLSPVEGHYYAGNNFSLEASVSDLYLDQYTVTLLYEEQGVIPEEEVLFQQKGSGITGEIGVINVLALEKDKTYTIKLEAWDKAGNYRTDSFLLTRPYTSEEFIEQFSVAPDYASMISPPIATFTLKEAADVTLLIKQKDGTLVHTYSRGVQPAVKTDFTMDITGISDGKYDVYMEVVYNNQTYVTYSQLVIDNTGPVVTISEFGHVFVADAVIPVSASITEENLESFVLKLLRGDHTVISTLKTGNAPDECRDLFLYPAALAEGDYFINLEAVDLAGNTGGIMYDLSIDRSGPQITITSPPAGAVLNAGIDIAASVSDPHGVGTYTISIIKESIVTEIATGSGSSPAFTWNSLEESDKVFPCTIRITALDSYGNTSEISRDITIDNNPPYCFGISDVQQVITGDKVFSRAGNRIYLQAVSGDNVSDIAHIYYSINGSSPTVYTDPLTFTAEDEYFLSYFADDTTGNQGNAREVHFFLDDTNPVYTLTIGQPNYQENGKTYISLNNNIEIIADDGSGLYASGVRDIHYNLDGGVWQEYTGSTLNVSRDGPVNLGVWITDYAGNSTIAEILDIIVDYAPPETTLSCDVAFFRSLQRPIVALAEAGSIQLTAAETGNVEFSSGVQSTLYSLDSVSQTYTSSIPIIDDVVHELHFYSTDNVGNTEANDPLQVAVDITPPVVWWAANQEVFQEGDTLYSRGDFILSLEGDDNFAGLKAIHCSLDGLPFEPYTEYFSFAGEQDDALLIFYGEDYLGLCSTVTEINIAIDDTPPATILTTDIPLVEINGEKYSDSRYTFSCRSEDNKSGVAATYVELDGQTVDPAGFTISAEGIHTITWYSADNLGQVEETKTRTIINPIPDLTPPVTTLHPSYTPWTDGIIDYYHTGISFTLTAADILNENESFASGVAATYADIDGLGENPYNNEEITFDSEGIHSIAYYSVDNVENVEIKNTSTFILDDTAPVSRLEFNGYDPLYQDGMLYISETDEIAIVAEDEYAGIKEIYYRLDDSATWNIYTNTFCLGQNNYRVQFYAVDNLDNTEAVRTINILIDAAYSDPSYESTLMHHFHEEVTDHAVSEEYLAMVINHLGNYEIRYRLLHNTTDLTLEDLSVIPGISGEKIYEILINEDNLFFVQGTEGIKTLYLVDLAQPVLTSEVLSVESEIRNVVCNGDYILWLPENPHEVIIYSLPDRTVFYKNLNNLNARMIKSDGIKPYFLFESLNSWIICVLNYYTFVPLYYMDKSAEITDFVCIDNLLAFELDGSEIQLIKNEPDAVNPYATFPGHSPRIYNHMLYYIKDTGSMQKLMAYNIANRKEYSLLRAGEIRRFYFNHDDIFIERKAGGVNTRSFLEKYYTSPNIDSIINGFTHECTESDLLRLCYIDSSQLISGISFADNHEEFIHNLYTDEEDLIYPDADLVFPPLLPPFKGMQSIQRTGTTSNSLTFHTEMPVDIYIVAPVSSTVANDNPQFVLSTKEIFTLPSAVWDTVNEQVNFTLHEAAIPADTDVNIILPQTATPYDYIIFIGNQQAPEIPVWNSYTTYNTGEVVMYEGQLYTCQYSTHDFLPTSGRPWAKVLAGIMPNEWEANQKYYEDEFVTYEGRIYKTVGHAWGKIPKNGYPWKLICCGYIPAGWDTNQTYFEGDVVYYNDCLYIARRGTTGEVPSPLCINPWEKL